MKVSVSVSGLTRLAGRAQADRIGEAARRVAERRLLGGSQQPADAEPAPGEK